MFSPIAKSVILKRRNQTTLKLLGNVFIHVAASSKLSLHMAELCKKRILLWCAHCASDFYSSWNHSYPKTFWREFVAILNQNKLVILYGTDKYYLRLYNLCIKLLGMISPWSCCNGLLQISNIIRDAPLDFQGGGSRKFS